MGSKEFVKKVEEDFSRRIFNLHNMQTGFEILMARGDFKNRLTLYPNNSLDEEDPAYKKLEALEKFSENPTFEVSGCGMKNYTIGFTNFINNEVRHRTLSERVYNFISDTPIEELAHSIIDYCHAMCHPTNEFAYTDLYEDLGKAQIA